MGDLKTWKAPSRTWSIKINNIQSHSRRECFSLGLFHCKRMFGFCKMYILYARFGGPYERGKSSDVTASFTVLHQIWSCQDTGNSWSKVLMQMALILKQNNGRNIKSDRVPKVFYFDAMIDAHLLGFRRVCRHSDSSAVIRDQYIHDSQFESLLILTIICRAFFPFHSHSSR